MKKDVRKSILKALKSIEHGGTISDLEKIVPYERHTISKYLSVMERDGVLVRRNIGKAKFYNINLNIWQTIRDKTFHTYYEKALMDLLDNLPSSIFVIDDNYSIIFQNKTAQNRYDCKEGKLFQQVILGKEKPSEIKMLQNFVNGKVEKFQAEMIDINKVPIVLKGTRVEGLNIKDFLVVSVRNKH